VRQSQAANIISISGLPTCREVNDNTLQKTVFLSSLESPSHLLHLVHTMTFSRLIFWGSCLCLFPVEHHLATNIQRNRLVQHDLQVAKQLQEEEDLKARAQIQKRQKDL